MSHICKHFAIHELVPKSIFKKLGEKAWELLDERYLITLDRLRKRYGKMYMNNYKWGGNKQWQGLRTPDSPDYSETSQHTFGRAGDPKFANVTSEQVRQDMKDHPEWECFEFITSIELNISWFHFDTRNCIPVKAFNGPLKRGAL